MRGNTLKMSLSKWQSNTTLSLYQYDYGQKLIFTGVTLPIAYEVHFSNTKNAESITMIGDETGVNIPDELLLTGEPIYVWLFLHADEDDGETEYQGIINVKKRSKPSDIEPTPVEQSTIDQTIAALNAAVNKSNENVRHYPHISEEGYWMVYDADQDQFVDTGIKAIGVDGVGIVSVEKTSTSGLVDTYTILFTDGNTTTFTVTNGEDGFVPTATVTKSGKIATISITDKNGTTTATVSDGEDADPTILIDDTAGDGVTNKVWSANKTYDEFSGKADKADTVLDTTLSRGRAATVSYPIGVGSFAFGNNVAASGDYSHAEGLNALALSNYSHAEGGGQVHANAAYAHAEGRGAEANAEGAHAEGGWADARGAYSHAEGNYTDAVGNYSHAEGVTTYAAGSGSHAEGGNTVVAADATYGHAEGCSTHVENGGLYGHAEGYSNHVNAQAGHAEGYANSVSGNYGHAEGFGTTASGASGHSEGQGTTASGINSHAEGCSTTASGTQAHTEGYYTSAAGDYSHAEGNSTNAYGNNAHAEGFLTSAVGVASHAEGYNATTGKSAVGLADHTEGYETRTYSDNNDTDLNKTARHTEGYRTYATKQAAHAEGISTQAVAAGAHSEGGSTNASGDYAHSEGQGTNATGQYAHAEGGGTQATAMGAHAEGSGTRATEASAHAEGAGTYATGQCSHAEGAGTQATANYAHSEGSGSQANGGISHAEGAGSRAEGDVSHAEGASTNAYGSCSHSEGQCTTANGDCSHVSGAYNVADSYTNWPAWVANTHYDVGDKVKITASGVTTGYICNTENTDAEFTAAHWINRGGMMNYAEIVGNGSSSGYSNARALDWDGNEYLMGDIFVNCNPDGTGGTKITPGGNYTVATLQETQAIIDAYDEEEENEVMTFETVFDYSGSVPCFVTVDDAADIFSAYTSGKAVRIHFPTSAGASSFSCTEAYVDAVRFEPGSEPGTGYMAFSNDEYAGVYILVNNSTINANGKLVFGIYYD